MKRPIVIYHGGCPDGFGSAYSFWKKYADTVEYCPMRHGDELPDVDLRDVYIADFSFRKPIMEEIIKRANKVVIIDHHITAINDLKSLRHPLLEKNFDLKSSGATLSWKYLFDEEPPLLLNYIEDRDLYKWELPDARALLVTLDSFEKDFEVWDEFAKKVETKEGFDSAVDKGNFLLKYIREITEAIKKNVFSINIRGIKFPALNTAVFFRGEILTEVAKESESGIAAGFHFDGEKYIFSLRSAKGFVDVAKIAESFPGGGGHKSAAGFRVTSLDEL